MCHTASISLWPFPCDCLPDYSARDTLPSSFFMENARYVLLQGFCIYSSLKYPQGSDSRLCYQLSPSLSTRFKLQTHLSSQIPYSTVLVWMFVSPQNIGVEIQTPIGDGTRRGAFGGGHKDVSPPEQD